MSFRRALFEAINKTIRRPFLNIISTGKKSTSFRCTFFDLISVDKKSTLFRFIVWCNFNGKLMQLWNAYFDVFLREKLLVILKSLLISFSYIRCNFVPAYFFKVVYFHFATYLVITQCLRTFTKGGIWYNLT